MRQTDTLLGQQDDEDDFNMHWKHASDEQSDDGVVCSVRPSQMAAGVTAVFLFLLLAFVLTQLRAESEEDDEDDSLLVPASQALRLLSDMTSKVRHVNASDFQPSSYDRVVDVRNWDEFVSNLTTGGNCSVNATVDPLACTYGHIQGAQWLPGLFHCGESTMPYHMTPKECSERRQWLADMEILGPMQNCAKLTLAFICHSGVRSLVAAERYNDLMGHMFANEAAKGHVFAASVDGGMKAWSEHHRPVERGPPNPKIQHQRCDEFRFGDLVPSTASRPPGMQHPEARSHPLAGASGA